MSPGQPVHTTTWCRRALCFGRACFGYGPFLALALTSGASATQSDQFSGATIYKEAGCFACHGGLGYGGAGPRFRGDKLLSADTYVVGQILIGRGIMPAYADKLSDAEIAAVATYIRTSWGNAFGPVEPHRVAEIRATLADQESEKAWQKNGSTGSK